MNVPLACFPSGNEEKRKNAHESSYPSCVETGQTTAQSQNEHKKRQQQRKAMVRTGWGTLVKGMLEGLEGHKKRATCQPLYLVTGHNLSKIALLVLGGGEEL